MLSGLLDAICTSQITFGNQMATDAISAENCSSTLVLISTAWVGTPVTDQTTVPQDGDNLPVPKDPKDPSEDYYYTTSQIQAMVNWIAIKEQTLKGDDLAHWQVKASTWNTESGTMGSFADLQKSPWNTLQQGESSQIQQDQSAVSASSSLASGISDFDGITASLVPSIQ